jgi:ABC-2 type transport system ATP-binding protein
VKPEQVAAARGFRPIHERQVLGRSILLFDLKLEGADRRQVDRQQIAVLGEVRTPSIADLFVAVMGDSAGQSQGAAR